jgi:hypothetical protein
VTDVDALFARPDTVAAEITLANITEALGLPDDAHGDDVLRAVLQLRSTAHAAGGPIVIRLPYTRPPVTANEARNGAAHWSGQNKAKRNVAEAVVALVRQHQVPQLARVAVTLTWYAPDYGTRDCDGLYPMLKAVLDALTPPQDAIPKGAPTKAGTPRKTSKAAKLGAGIIPGDHASIVASTTTAIVQGDPDPRIELTLQPLLAAPPRPTRRRPTTPRRSPALNVSRPARRKTPALLALDDLCSPATGQVSPQNGATTRERPTRQETR